MNISSGVGTDGLKMVLLLCVFADGLVKVLAYLFWDVGIGILEWSDSLERSLDCEVGMQLVDFGWLIIGQLDAGLFLEEAG